LQLDFLWPVPEERGQSRPSHFTQIARLRTAWLPTGNQDTNFVFLTATQAVSDALRTITADNAAAWFRHCGYQGTPILVSL
jgi:hypothetical protein